MSNGKPTVLLFMDLIQDLDLIRPFLLAAKNREDLSFKVCVTDWLVSKSPRVENTLRELGIEYSVPFRRGVKLGIQPQLHDVQVLITAAESTAGPHKAAHLLTKRANAAGIHTYTLQHGFENIGLTYFDERETPESIQFASSKILLWGDVNLLAPEALPETISRCIPVGCPKEISPVTPEIKIPGKRDYAIAIFENLHWHRYSEDYRQSFLADLETTARRFPNTTFLVKPHHAGMWLTHRYKGNLPNADNIIIADPKLPQWEAYTAAALIKYVDAAITTPSTVAVDAARAGCPVSVVSYDLELENYAPLMRLKSTKDWFSFVNQIQNSQKIITARNQAQAFVERNLISGDPIQRILDLIAADIAQESTDFTTINQLSYPSKAEILFLASLPLEYQYRNLKPEEYFKRLSTERGLFLGDALTEEEKAKNISLLLLVEETPSAELGVTLKSWQLQSCPLVDCWLIPLGNNSSESLTTWLEKQDFSGKIQVWKDNHNDWLQLADKSDFVLFSRPGDLLAPTLATTLKLFSFNSNPDVVVWNLQQLAGSEIDELTVKEFLRRPQLELHSLRHINYIGTGFAVKPDLAANYPDDLFDCLVNNDGHLFQLWLGNQVGLQWQTHPEYCSLRAAKNRPESLQKLVNPYLDIYRKIFSSLEDEFEFVLQADEQQPYQLKPRRQAESISAIVPFRDKPDYTIRCLASLFKQRVSGSLEIILVNNQSTQNSLAQIKSYLEEHQSEINVKIIDYDFPFNHSRQCNLGAKVARGEVLFFLNNDAEILSESALAEMAAWALVASVTTVGCQIISPDGKQIIAGLKAKKATTSQKLSLVEECRDRKYAGVVRETYGNSFACVAIAKNRYEELGGLNEKEFPNGFNDVEFNARSRAAGYTNIYLGHLQVEHLSGTSRGRCDEFLQTIILRQRFLQPSADSLFQLERDETFKRNLETEIKAKNVKLQQKEVKSELKKLKQENKKLAEKIAAMKTSKFWQLRAKWFRLKKLLKLAKESE
ncbi:MAG: glycosyltransferase [Oscillatoria sp. PMC 1051.18]|nr:glycosyltransferase [Oscillatoria sp. PMC 1050.18]MEC5029307.1 glycosyltransferase [Oscillatoria sp. PMC 1051.18]